jgi:hypothetical protein
LISGVKPSRGGFRAFGLARPLWLQNDPTWVGELGVAGVTDLARPTSRRGRPLANAGAALAVLVLAALASDAWGQSQRPPDTEQAKPAQQPPAIDQRGTAQSPARSSAPAPPHSSQIYFSERPHRLHRKVMKSGLVSLTSCPATIMSVPQSRHAGSSPVSNG